MPPSFWSFSDLVWLSLLFSYHFTWPSEVGTEKLLFAEHLAKKRIIESE